MVGNEAKYNQTKNTSRNLRIGEEEINYIYLNMTEYYSSWTKANSYPKNTYGKKFSITGYNIKI